MERPVLYSWTALRSGPGISVTHSCGKITGITGIGAIDGRVIATKGDGSTFDLHVRKAPTTDEEKAQRVFDAADKLAEQYRADGDNAGADLLAECFAELPRSSAARLFDIL